LNNQAPLIFLTGSPPLPDTTFAAATVTWAAYDNDGDVNGMTFQLWVDGGAAPPHLLPAGTSSFTLTKADFAYPNGVVPDSNRTVKLRAVDDGGLTSQTVSYTWHIKSPGADTLLLLIDDMPSTVPFASVYDDFYRTNVSARVFAGRYTVLDLERLRPFRSSEDLYQTFKLFRAVMWYREINTVFSTLLRDYQGGIGKYLVNNGRFYLAGQNLVEGPSVAGPLTLSFVQNYLGSDSLFLARAAGVPNPSADWSLNNTRRLYSTLVYMDSLQCQSTTIGVRGFGVRDTSFAAFWANPNVLSPPHAARIPVGVNVPQPGGGRAILVSFPFVPMNGVANSGPRVFAKILDDLQVQVP
jgi:hypothetical protein